MTATSRPLVLLTRRSALARWQADLVAGRLRAAGTPVEIRLVTSQGDRDRATPLAAMGGVGVFTKALQEELLAGRGDLAVHSLKDLPARPPAGLELAACLARAEPEDALVSAAGHGVDELPAGAVVGTGSPRRRAFLGARRPDLRFVELRGNLDTRLNKVFDGEVDAAVLARAGLARMGWWDPRCRVLDPRWMVPAPGQGLLGVECRAGSAEAARVRDVLDEPGARAEATAERAVLRGLAAGCATPVGALARAGEGGRVVLHAALAGAGGIHQEAGEGDDPEALGASVAAALKAAAEVGS